MHRRHVVTGMESRIFTRIFHHYALSCYILHMQYAILSFFRNLETPLVNTLANALSMLGEEGVMIFIMLIVYYVWDKRAGFCVLSSLIGPALVTLSDLLGRTVLSPSELPAGIFMAVIGVPFFIFLLLRRLK